MTGRHRCIACGEPTLSEPPPGTYEICSDCGWEDDVPVSGVDERSGANGCTLREFRRDGFREDALQAFWAAGNQHGLPQMSVQLPSGDVVEVDVGADWYGDRVDSGVPVDRTVVADGASVMIVLAERH